MNADHVFLLTNNRCLLAPIYPYVFSLLNKYPGFPQAEYLYYPLMVCRRVTRLLRDSTTAYPEVLRTMTGLDVGWLARR